MRKTLRRGGRRMVAASLAVPLAFGACDTEVVPPSPDGGALEVFVEGLDQPVSMTTAPGDDRRVYVVEKPGRIRVVLDGALQSSPFLDIASITASGGEQGLLGLAFDPGYAANGTFYVQHTDNGGDSRVLRFQATGPDAADGGSLQVVLEVDQPYSNHNGGDLAFGPDGMLYVALGDGGSGGDPDGNGQNRETLLGSILRIDVDATPYAVPADNPFVGQAPFAPEIWGWGLRNPWRFSFDRATGDLWIGDVGQGDLEEISHQPASSTGGENYGWARLEGSRCYPADPCDSAGTVLPAYEYTHDDGCSVTGGYVYRGSAYPDFAGRYFFADYCSGWIRSFYADDGRAVDVYDHTDDFGTVASIASFGEDASGELYVVSMSGTIYRITDPA